MVSVYVEIMGVAEMRLQAGKEREALQDIIDRIRAILEIQKN